MALFTPHSTLSAGQRTMHGGHLLLLCLGILLFMLAGWRLQATVLSANEQRRSPMILPQAQPNAPQAPGTLRGRVTDQQDQPLAGMTVELYTIDSHNELVFPPMRITQTDANGFYTFALLHPNSYLVKFSDPNRHYGFQFYPGATLWQAAEPLVLIGEQLTDIDAHLFPGGTIAGTITAPTPTAVYLTLYAQVADQGWQQVLSKRYDPPNGETTIIPYRLDGLPAATYHLCLWAIDTHWNECYAGHPYENNAIANADSIPVVASAIVTDINFQWTACRDAPCIEGTILSSTGQPLPYIHIFVSQKTEQGWSGSSNPYKTATDGTFRLWAVAGERYALEFVDPTQTFVNEFYHHALTLQDATLITAPLTTPLTITLTPAAQLTGTVRLRGETGVYSTGAVYAYRLDTDVPWAIDRYVARAAVDSLTGRYTLRGLRAGRYVLRAQLELMSTLADYPTLTEFYGESKSVATATVLSITAGATLANLDMNLGEDEFNSAISGRITAEGVPLPNAVVELLAPLRPDQPFVQSATDSAGVYTFAGLVSGAYALRVTDPTFAFATRYYGRGIIPPEIEAITITESSVLTGIDMDLVRAGAISGHIWPVQNKVTGRKIIEASLRTSFVPEEWTPVAKTTPDPNGVYELRGLLPGAYRIFVYDSSHAEWYGCERFAPCAGVVIDVQPGMTATNIDIIFGRDQKGYLPLLRR